MQRVERTTLLGHAYATTVHRFQGSTVDRAHLFADGGGQELAYVAMSRARHASTAYVVADDLDQAQEDLARDWATRRTPTWAIDTALPTGSRTSTDPQPVREEERAGVVALCHARDRLLAATRPGPPPAPPERPETVRAAVAQTRQHLTDLVAVAGAYTAGPTGPPDALARRATANQPPDTSSSPNRRKRPTRRRARNRLTRPPGDGPAGALRLRSGRNSELC